MSTPKIGYEIGADVTGRAEVDALARAFEGLEIPPELQQRAAGLVDTIEQLARARTAVAEFQRLGEASRAANAELAKAETQFTELRREIEKSGEATASQAGRLQKFAEALQAARDRAATAKTALEGARTALSDVGQAGTTLGKAGEALAAIDQAARKAADDVKGLSTEVQNLQRTQAAVQQLETAFKTLGMRGVKQTEQQIRDLRNAVAQIKLADPFGPDVARATAAANARIAELNASLQGTPKATAAAAAGMREVEGGGKGVVAALGGAARSALAWTAALTGISGVQAARSVVQTGAAFEGLRTRLEQVLGSTQAAATAFDLIKKTARETPFEVNDLTEAYVKLSAFGLKPTESQLLALADTAAVAGGGTQALERVTLALGQAWTKGKLQGEEILQLAEAGVPVWDLLAKATGRNVVELQELSRQGALGRDVVLKLFEALGAQNAGASAKLMQTFNGAVANAKDALAEFFDLISRSGVLDYLTKQLQGALVEFDKMKDSGELERRAKEIADGFVSVAEAAKVMFGAVQQLAQLAPALAGLYAASKVVDFVSGLRTAAVAAAGLSTAMAATTAAAATTGAAVAGAAGSVGLLARAMSLLGRFTAAGAVLGIGELVMEFFKAKKAAEDGDEAVREMLTADPPPMAKQAIRDVNAELDDFRKKLPGLQNDLAGLSGSGLASFGRQTIENLRAIKADAETSQRALVDLGTRAAQDLGVTLPAALGRVTPAVAGAKDSFELLLQTLPNLQRQGVDTGAIVAQALGNMIKKAETQRDLQEVEGFLNGLGQRGVIGPQLVKESLQEVADKAREVKQATEDATPGAQGIAEAARKAGVEVAQLTGGISENGRKAVGTLSDLVGQIIATGVSAERASPVLAGAFDKRIAAAQTKAELDELRKVVDQAQASGKLMGTTYEGALGAIARKAKELDPALQDLEKSATRFGVSLEKVAKSNSFEALTRAYEKLKASGKLSDGDLAKAFKEYARQATEANGGVVPEAIKVEAALRGVEVAGQKAGDAVKSGMEAAGAATDRARASADGYSDSLNFSQEWENKRRQERAPGHTYSVLGQGGAVSYSGGGQYAPPDDSGDWYFDTAAFQREGSPYMLQDAAMKFWRLKPEAYARRSGTFGLGAGSSAATGPGSLSGSVGGSVGGVTLAQQVGELDAIRAANPSAGRVIQPGTGAEAGATSIVVNLGGRSATVTADPSNAQALVRLLQEQARQAGGG